MTADRVPVVEDEICALPYFAGRVLLRLGLDGSFTRSGVQPGAERRAGIQLHTVSPFNGSADSETHPRIAQVQCVRRFQNK